MTREQDRLVEIGLEELLGGEAPPDLSEAILARAREPRPASAPEPGPGPTRGPRLRLLPFAAAAALALVLLRLLPSVPNLSAAELRLELRRGSLRLVPADTEAKGFTWQGPGPLLVQVGLQDRFETASNRTTELDLEGMGRLVLDRGTELVVIDMETRTVNTKTVVTSLVLGVATGAATHLLLTESRAAGPGDRVEIRSGDLERRSLTELRTANAELERRNAELAQRVAELEQDPRRRIEVTENLPEPQPEAPAEVAVTGPAFDDPRYAEGLDEVDWNGMGEAMRDMLPLFDELVARWEADGKPPLEIAGKLQELNGKLVAQLEALQDSGLPGSDHNGVFTHPLVVSNQVERLLALSELPLSEQQRERLSRLTRDFTQEDEVRRAEAAQDEFGLTRVLAETGVKDRYYEEMAALLTPEQRQRLYSDRTKDRSTLDLFSSGLVWLQYARPMPAKDFDDLASKISTDASKSLGLSGDQQKRLQGIVAEWSRTLPRDLLDWKPDFFDRQGRFRTARIRQAATLQLALMRRLGRELSLSDEARKELAQALRVWVPIPSR